MLIRFASDLHTEFWPYNKFVQKLDMALPPLETDKETVLVLGGDCGTFKYYNSTYFPLFQLLGDRYKAVMYVYGNHSWYNSSVWGREKEFWADKELPDNVHILQNDYEIVNNVVFIGATLWTDFNGDDYFAKRAAEQGMNDFDCIKWQDYVHPDCNSKWSAPICRRIAPEDTIEAHRDSKKFIFKAIDIFRQEEHNDKKIVVLTHHMPSGKSVHPQFYGNSLNYAYFSHLDEHIAHRGPDIWLHGHTHNSFDYMIEDTRILCNPFGYLDDKISNREYIPELIVEM